MASEQFSLCWDNFHKNMSSGMNSLLENEDLVDVTLAVEGKCLKAHKMVLSVCSPYFKELFKSNPCQHPIVFMKDVSYVAISDLLQFMYQGEVQVSQENLTTFIKTAEALQIKGLTGDGNGSADDAEIASESRQSAPVEEYRPVPKPKKQPPPPVVTTTPAPKRPRLDSQSTPAIQTKQEPPASVDPPIQFKMEPYDNTASGSVHDETGDDNFGDDTLDDNTVDDTEDYSMMEGGDEGGEPQAGTSTDGAGEGQEKWANISKSVAGTNRDKGIGGIVVDGFLYHVNRTKEITNVRYLVCGEYKRLVCRARAHIPTGCGPESLVLSESHNHPPHQDACRKAVFVKDIRQHVTTDPDRPLRVIYEHVARVYIGCAEHKRLGCRGRALVPVDGPIDQLRVTQPHNHPPDTNVEEKHNFVVALKRAAASASMEGATLKKVYDFVAEAYPNAAEEISFRSVSSSLHRWRKNPEI